MNRTSKGLLILFVSVVSIVGVFFYYDYQRNDQSKSFIVSSSDIVPILVLHRNQLIEKKTQIHSIDEDQFFLLLKKNNSLYLFTELEQLRPFDHDHDNIVDNSDPVYNNLYIGQYDKNKQILVYHPINQTAIRAIRLDIDENNNIVQGQTIYTGNHQNMSLMGLFLSARAFVKEDLYRLKIMARPDSLMKHHT